MPCTLVQYQDHRDKYFVDSAFSSMHAAAINCAVARKVGKRQWSTFKSDKESMDTEWVKLRTHTRPDTKDKGKGAWE